MEGRKVTMTDLRWNTSFVLTVVSLCVHASHIQVMSFFNQMEGSLYISVAYARALKFTFYILTVTHIGACIWFPLGCYSQNTYELFPMLLMHVDVCPFLTHLPQMLQFQLGHCSWHTFQQLTLSHPRLHHIPLLGLGHSHIRRLW